MGLPIPPADYSELRRLADHLREIVGNPMPGNMYWRKDLVDTLTILGGKAGLVLPTDLAQLVRWMTTNKAILSVEPGENGPVGAMCQVSLSIPYEHPTRKDLTGFIYQDVQVPTGQILDKANPKFVSDVIMNLITAVEEERNTHNASEGDEAKPETPATTQLDVRV